MKNLTTWLIVGGIGIYVLLKLRMAQALQYSISNVSMDATNILTPTLSLTLNILNPTNTSTTLNSINVTLYSQGQPIGNILASYNQVIAANTTTQLVLPINVQLGGLISDIYNTILSQGTNLEIKGTITADIIPIPIDVNYAI